MNSIRFSFEARNKQFGFREEDELIDIMKNFIKNKNKIKNQVTMFLKKRHFRSIEVRKEIVEDIENYLGV